MPRSRLILSLLCLSMLLPEPVAFGQEEYIYLIRVTDKSGENSSLTGFRLQGVSGIVTCLHGVAGAEIITVQGSRKVPLLDDPVVKLMRVDIEHDLALLGSEALTRLGTDGLSIPQDVEWSTLKGVEVRIIGYPINIDQKEVSTSLRVRQSAIERLRDLIDPQTRIYFQKRKSPTPSQQVLNLQGNMLPGHSGAPILDAENRVIAVANGGLRGGTVGHCWAIPLTGGEVRWQDPEQDSMKQEIARISKMTLSTHFRIITPDTLRNLRSSLKTLSRDDILKMIKERGFNYEGKQGSFQHELQEEIQRGERVIIDKTYGLMWEQSGSEAIGRPLAIQAEKHIETLNNQEFAGYTNWRLPTMEELMSLMVAEKTHELHIDGKFDSAQARCWSIDRSGTVLAAQWIIDFEEATFYDSNSLVWTVYVRPVRSIER